MKAENKICIYKPTSFIPEQAVLTVRVEKKFYWQLMCETKHCQLGHIPLEFSGDTFFEVLVSFEHLQDGRVFIWTCDDPAGNTWTAKLLHKFNDVVWHVSWSITGNILAVSGGDNKVEYKM